MVIESENLESKQSQSQERSTILESHSQGNSKQVPIGQPHTNWTAFGMAGEELVRYLIHMWNYPMCVPLDPSAPFDLLVKGENDWITIQIKHSIQKTFKLKREGGGKNTRTYKTYQKGDFDYLFVCQFPYIYIVPWDHLKAVSCFTFSMYKDYRHDLTDEKTYVNKVILEKGRQR